MAVQPPPTRRPASTACSESGETRRVRNRGLAFHTDGSFYAELDVIRPHPKNERLLVEAVNAWGRGRDIRVEPRLMPMVC
jgi:hypothetical protein